MTEFKQLLIKYTKKLDLFRNKTELRLKRKKYH